MNLASKMNPNLGKISVSKIRQFDQLVSQIPDIIKLTLGEPDFNTPHHIQAAGHRAIQENRSHYTSMMGLETLRAAASRFFEDRYQLKYDADSEILVTVGVTEAIATVLLSILVPGDQVLIPAPAYPGYHPLITLAGAEVVEIDTRQDHFVLEPENLRQVLDANPKTKALILNQPANPTGTTYSRDQIQALSEVIAKHEIFVISDEVYSELNYTDQGHWSPAHFLPDQTLILNGLSKSHAMTGWRIGFILAPQNLTAELKKIHQYLVTSATTLSQYAGLEALTKGVQDPEPMRAAYIKRRDYILQRMTALGFQIIQPTGAFYIFAKIPEDLDPDSFRFCLDLAQERKIAFTPGSAFGSYGEGYVRLSYAASMEVIQLAMDRLTAYVREKRA